MATVEEYIKGVDSFMQQPKRLVGADENLAPWPAGRDPGTFCVKLPLEVSGEQMGQMLFVVAHPQHPTLRFSIGIAFEPAICRLDYWLEGVHQNGFTAHKQGLVPLIKGSHYHRWEINKASVESPNKPFRLHNAVPYSEPRQFDAALRWFCSENRIQLPPKHTIELPLRSRLI